MLFTENLGVSYFDETPIITSIIAYEGYDKRKKIKRPCSIIDYNSGIANIYWEDTRRRGRISLEFLEFKWIIPKKEEILKLGLIIDSQTCWKCKNESYYILGVEVICRDKYIRLNSAINKKLFELFDKDILSKFNLGEIKERYSYTRQISYLSHGCYHCDAIFGSYYINEDILEYEINFSWPKAVDVIEITYEKYFEITSDVLIFNDALLRDRQKHLKEIEYHLNNLEDDKDEDKATFKYQTLI